MKISSYLKFDSSFEKRQLSIVDYVDEGVSAKDLKREQYKDFYVRGREKDRLNNSSNNLEKIQTFRKNELE